MEENRPGIWLPHRVSYGETDAMRVVYYAEYLHYFERARTEYCRRCGLPYSEIEKSGFMLPVREAQCRYRSPARYDDLIQIHMVLAEARRASVRFEYEIWDERRERLLCTGMTLHAFTDMNARPAAIPPEIREKLSPPCAGSSSTAAVPAPSC